MKSANLSCSKQLVFFFFPLTFYVILFLSQLKEAHTLRYVFMENSVLCYDVTEKVVQHIVHCIETQGRHVEYLKVLQTLVKAEGQSIRKTQDMVMAEVRYNSRDHEFRFEKWLKERWR